MGQGIERASNVPEKASKKLRLKGKGHSKDSEVSSLEQAFNPEAIKGGVQLTVKPSVGDKADGELLIAVYHKLLTSGKLNGGLAKGKEERKQENRKYGEYVRAMNEIPIYARISGSWKPLEKGQGENWQEAVNKLSPNTELFVDLAELEVAYNAISSQNRIEVAGSGDLD